MRAGGRPAALTALLGRSARSQAEGVNLAGQFLGKQGRDHPVAVQTRATFECRGNNFNANMRFPFRPGSDVTLMACGFIDNFQARRRQRRFQFPFDGFSRAHSA